MSVSYKAVGWTPHKKLYDAVLLISVLIYLGLFTAFGLARDPQTTIETQLIRALGTCAFVMLHLILSIGPLCRIDPRFLPLLYNRRHFGVTMFLVALAHGIFSTVQFHTLGVINPMVSILTSNGRYESLSQFPFQPLGLAALTILFLMAATSHDFWLANLTAPTWKALHMLVYVAYGLLVLHVALGSLQAERSPVPATLLSLGVATLLTLHLLAASMDRSADKDLPLATDSAAPEGWVEVGCFRDIPTDRARIVGVSGERVAVFRYEGKISAVSNVCQHQNGPLGEGKVIDGCITCPWHGYQYEPDSGRSPAPFTEKIPTFRVTLVGEVVYIDPTPLLAGTRTEPAVIPPTLLEGESPRARA